MIGVVSRIHDDMLRIRQAFDEAARLRAIPPLARCDDKSDRQAERIDSGVDFRRQPAFGAANTGSFKPPF